MAERPYLVKRDGKIHDRATGERVGEVRLRSGEGWVGYLLGAGYPEDPWQQTRITRDATTRRYTAIRLVWQAHEKRTTTPEEKA